MMGVLFGLQSAAVGCGTMDVAGDRPDAGTPDAGPPAAILRVEGEPMITLLFAERAPIAVVYTEADGTPSADAEVGFAFEGRANDSTLAQLRAAIDGTGRAVGDVLAGMTPAAFQVRMRACGPPPTWTCRSATRAGALRVEIA
jgi:hypothetical protein